MRRSPRNLRIACDHRGLTHFGGVYFFHEFLQLLQLRDFLARHLRYPRRNHRYSLSQMILALVYPGIEASDPTTPCLFDMFRLLFRLPLGSDPRSVRTPDECTPVIAERAWPHRCFGLTKLQGLHEPWHSEDRLPSR
jgi:hypothetical protein